jgi:hypothetical protein
MHSSQYLLHDILATGFWSSRAAAEQKASEGRSPEVDVTRRLDVIVAGPRTAT